MNEVLCKPVFELYLFIIKSSFIWTAYSSEGYKFLLLFDDLIDKLLQTPDSKLAIKVKLNRIHYITSNKMDGIENKV